MSAPTVRVFDRGNACHELLESRYGGWLTGCGVSVTRRASRDGSPSEVTCPDCLLMRRIRFEHTGEEVES